MSWTNAVEQAPPDPVGMRYATAHSRGRTYLAWQSSDGRRGVQITHEHFGIRRHRRVLRAPQGLCWTPVASWTAASDEGGRLSEEALPHRG